MISVIIACTRPGMAQACLEGLAAQSNERVEAVVVGDVSAIPDIVGGMPVIRIACEERHANVRRNLGVERCSGDRIAFLDDDTVPLPGWVDAALSLDVNTRQVMTGPETPLRDHPTSRLLHAVCSSWLAEGTRAHTNPNRSQVPWTDVPFCNCVMPRHVVERHGPLPTHVPSDLDDLAFFFPMRHDVRFENVPQLAVRHDRYPETISAFLRYRWRLRQRTGEKLVSHWFLYRHIPNAVLCAAAPWAALLLLALAPSLMLWTALAYGCLLLTQGQQAKSSGQPEAFLKVMVLLHFSTLVALQSGLWRGLWRRQFATASARNGPGRG